MTGEAQVDAVLDPLRIRLLDQRIIQLSGIDIPDLTPYDTGDLGAAAMELMAAKLVNKTVQIYQAQDSAKGRTNRMGYELAHLVEKNDGWWVQGALLDAGLARVRPSSVNIEMAAPMAQIELEARNAKKGLWESEDYAVLTPDNAANALNGWAIVEGTVKATAMMKNNVFLNFGPDWRSDFTVGIPPAVRRTLTNAGIDPLQYAHKTIRVRGWIEDYNGPYIELMDPVWIEILPAPSEQATLDQ